MKCGYWRRKRSRQAIGQTYQARGHGISLHATVYQSTATAVTAKQNSGDQLNLKPVSTETNCLLQLIGRDGVTLHQAAGCVCLRRLATTYIVPGPRIVRRPKHVLMYQNTVRLNSK